MIDDAGPRRTTCGLGAHSYGKDGIRILTRGDVQGEAFVRDLTLDLRISGNFSAAYLRGDNSTTLPTDAMRNHAFAVAQDLPYAEAEVVAAETLHRLLAAIPAADAGRASVTIHPWQPMAPPGDSAFVPAGWVGQAEVRSDRRGTTTTGGFAGLHLLRPFGSSFAGFYRDEMTDQADAVNRVLAGTVDVTWRYRGEVENYRAVRERARTAISDGFRAGPSPAIQQTVYQMGAAALNAAPELDHVTVVFTARPHGPAPTTGRRGPPSDAVWSVGVGPTGVTEATVRRS